MKRASLRHRLFWTLFLAALVPAAITLGIGTLVLREVVASTGSAGPWVAVAESGRELLDMLRAPELDPATREAAERHRAVLSESVRLSRVYSVLGERIVLLTPLAGLVLLGMVAAVAAAATRRLAGSLAAPAEELAEWIRALGAGERLPERDGRPARADTVEFQALREGLREAAMRLGEARKQELDRERARSWAEMSRRVAHEIKNPLTPMRMAAERVARSGEPATAEAGHVLMEEIGRLDALARSFSHFGRPVEGPAAPLDLEEMLHGLGRRFEAEGMPVAIETPAGPVVVAGHLDALERVIRNLVNNALEAQQRWATRGEAAPLDDAAVRVVLRTADAEAILLVEDRGPGIPPELRERVWEPDFTTRRRGTGLGLPLVKQVVDRHDGRIRLDDRPGGGTRVEIRLPLAADGNAPQPTGSQPAEPQPPRPPRRPPPGRSPGGVAP